MRNSLSEPIPIPIHLHADELIGAVGASARRI
jgi:hypothetical protein